MKPKSYLQDLIEYWDLISDLYKEVKDQPFHENQFFSALKKLEPSKYSIEYAYKIIESLKRQTIIETVPMSNKEFSFANLALKFIEGLLEEQKLSLHAELVVRVEALDVLIKKLENSIFEHDLSLYHNTCNEMDRLIRTIKSQVQDSRIAVFRIVEEAKLFPQDMPLKKRYAKTLDAWDSFVEPVLDMCNPNDPFSQKLSTIENALNNWLSDPSLTMLVLETDKKRLEVLKIRIIDFQDTIADTVDVMAKNIKPIVKMVRLNTLITKGATEGLRTLESLGPSKNWISEMGMGITKIKTFIRHGNQSTIESFMLQIIKHDETADKTPSITTDDLKIVSGHRDERAKVSEHTVIAYMKKLLPADNIFQITQAQFPEISAKTLITCMVKLSRLPGYKLARDDSDVVTIEQDNKIFTFSNRRIIKAKS
jgi:hypothetical protein